MAKKSIVFRNNLKKGTVQHRNRCNLCNRPRGFLRFFGLCRICLRKQAGEGTLPGVRKSSW